MAFVRAAIEKAPSRPRPSLHAPPTVVSPTQPAGASVARSKVSTALAPGVLEDEVTKIRHASNVTSVASCSPGASVQAPSTPAASRTARVAQRVGTSTRSARACWSPRRWRSPRPRPTACRRSASSVVEFGRAARIGCTIARSSGASRVAGPRAGCLRRGPRVWSAVRVVVRSPLAGSEPSMVGPWSIPRETTTPEGPWEGVPQSSSPLLNRSAAPPPNGGSLTRQLDRNHAPSTEITIR